VPPPYDHAQHIETDRSSADQEDEAANAASHLLISYHRVQEPDLRRDGAPKPAMTSAADRLAVVPSCPIR